MKINTFNAPLCLRIGLVTSLTAMLLLGSSALQAICNANVANTRPDNQYEVLAGSNGSEVRDKVTKLVWLRCVVGMAWNGTTCTGSSASLTWLQAADAVRNASPSRVSGSKLWRLPNHAELYSLADRACRSPAINSNWFPATPADGVWSSSVNAGYSELAWNVDFDGGFAYDGYKNQAYRVRLVRTIE